MVCLSLSVGTTFAMPQGGEVQVGDISGLTNGTVANGGTIGVNSNGLIDWQSFNIANGEALNFAFNGGKWEIINHVIGGVPSEIYGALSSTGNGHIMLINPSGITVGNQAVINVDGLTLSTLDASTDTLKSYLNGEADLVLGDGKNTSTAMVKVEDGAKIDFKSLLGLYGGKIQIADGVTIAPAEDGESSNKVTVLAASKASVSKNGGYAMAEAVADANELTVNDAKISAGNITLRGGRVTIENKTDLKAEEGLDVNSQNGNMKIYDSTIETSGGASFYGHSIDLAGSTVNAKSLSMRALQKSDSSVNINSNSKLKADEHIEVLGTKINVRDAEIKSGGDVYINSIDENQNDTTEANVLTVNNTSITAEGKAGSLSNGITLDGGKIVVENGSKLNSASGLKIDGQHGTFFDKGEVRISNSEINSGSMSIGGGESLKVFDSKLKSDTKHWYGFAQRGNYLSGGNVEVKNSKIEGQDLEITSENNLKITANSELYSKENIQLDGNAIVVEDSALNADKDITAYTKGKSEWVYVGDNVYEVGDMIVPPGPIQIKNSTFSTPKNVALTGSRIDADNTTVNAPRVRMLAANKSERGQGDEAATISYFSAVDNTVRLNNFTQNVPEGENSSLIVLGGKIDIEGKIATAPNTIFAAGKSHKISLTEDGIVAGVDTSYPDNSKITISEEAGEYLKNTNWGREYYNWLDHNSNSDGGNTTGNVIPNGASNSGSSAGGAATSGSSGSASGGSQVNGGGFSAMNLPASVPKEKDSVSQSGTAAASATSAEELLDASRIVLVTPAGQSMNHTVHQELDQAAKAPDAKVFTSAADTAGTVLENAATVEPVVVKDSKEKEQE